jgi:drug/metabolite transporter (DMT)-like permease
VLERFSIPAFQAIVFNYITCVITGSVVNGGFPLGETSVNEPWFKFALIMGAIFIMLFNLMAFTTQKIGIAVSSVANKLSLVIPFVFSLYLYNESSTWIKITGIVIALLAVFLTCLPPRKDHAYTQKKLSTFLLVLVPTILFLGSGLLDTLLKYVEQTFLNPTNNNAYLIASFASAASLGVIILIGLITSGKQKLDWRSITAGIIIGVPNYFSIWCLVHVLKDYQGRSSAIIPINNMGIVLLSSVLAWLLFKERLLLINWIGIILSLVAIGLIAFG